MHAFVRFIVRRATLLAIVSLTASAVSGWFVTRARIDNSIEVWMSRQSDQFQRYEAFRRRFGSDEMIVIAATMPDALSPRAFGVQRKLEAELRQIKGILDVTSLPDVYSAIIARSPNAAEAVSSQPLIRNLLLSEDQQTVGMVAWLQPLSGAAARRDIVDAVHRAAEVLSQDGCEPHIVGAPVLNAALDRASSEEARRLMPAAAAVSIGMLLLLFKSVVASATCMLATAGTLLGTVAGMAISGTTFNLVSVALPALLMVLSLAPAMHIVIRYRSRLAGGEVPRAAMRDTLRDLLMPLTLTTLTTVIGFASLLITDMRPVFEVGLFAMLGMFLSLLLSLLMVPGLLLWLPAPSRLRAQSSCVRSHWTAAAGSLAASHHKMVVAVSIILVPVVGLLARHIHAETNVLSFLPTDSMVANDYRFVSERLTGLYTLELDAAVPQADEPTALAALSQLAQALEANKHVARVDHYGEFKPLLVSGGLSALLPQSIDPVQKAASYFRVVEGDTVHLRASVMVRSMASADFSSVIDAADREATARMPRSARWNLTGVVLLMSNAQAALVRTQIRSFGIAALLVLLVIGALMRSWRVMAAAIVPNLLPILAMFALMALMKLSINPATVMIASVAIGLAVDATIHFLSAYRSMPASLNDSSATRAAMELAGRPIVFAALVAAAGFLLLATAKFAPLRQFGLLTGATLVIAMLCDVLITPAWAVLLRLRKEPHAVARH